MDSKEYKKAYPHHHPLRSVTFAGIRGQQPVCIVLYQPKQDRREWVTHEHCPEEFGGSGGYVIGHYFCRKDPEGNYQDALADFKDRLKHWQNRDGGWYTAWDNPP